MGDGVENTSIFRKRNPILQPSFWLRLCRARPFSFSPDGKTLAVLAPDQENGHAVRLWDVDRRSVRAVLKEAFVPLIFSPDGKALATGSWNPRRGAYLQAARKGCLWDVATGERRIAFSQPLDDFSASTFVFSPDGSILATFNRVEMRVQLWDVARGQMVGQTVPEPKPCSWIEPRFPPDGRLILLQTQMEDLDNWSLGQFRLWDIAARRTVLTIGGCRLAYGKNRILISVNPQHWYVKPLTGADSFSPDGKSFFTVEGVSQRLTLYSLPGLEVHGAIDLCVPETYPSLDVLQYTADGQTLVAGVSSQSSEPPSGLIRSVSDWLSINPGNHIWELKWIDTATGRAETCVLEKGFVHAQLSPDGRMLATINGGTVKLWDIPPRKPIEWLIVPAAVLAALILAVWWGRRARTAKGSVGDPQPGTVRPSRLSPATDRKPT